MDKSEKYRHRFVSYDETMNQANDSYLACELKKKMARPSVGCDIIFDSVLCWPQTPPNTLAVLPCFSQLNGIHYDTTNNASRFCFPNGTWDQYTDYSNCKELIDEEHDDEMTTKIYFIGYTISLVGLLIAVYIFCRFKDLRCLRNSIHMNLMISYILADFVWVLTYAIPISVSTKKTSCIFLVLLLHYFHLTNFFWMFIEGLYLYILVVKTFSGEHIKLRIYLMIGWGGPLLFVLFWGTAKSFTVPTDDQQSSGIRNCPWTYHVLDWIYQTPAMLLLVTNLIFLIIIMWVLITKLRSANNAETQQYRKAAKALLVLIPLLGVTHILVLVGPTHGLSKRIYEYVRAVLLSTQGFTVALFYCFLNMEVKNTLKHHFNSWHTTRSLGSRRSRYSSRDWSPRSRDSLRLYQGSFFKKRESTCSVGTTTTLVSVPVGGKTNSQQVRSPLLTSGDTG